MRRMIKKIIEQWKSNSYKHLENSTKEISVNLSVSIPDPHLRYQPNINGAFEDSEEVMFH